MSARCTSNPLNSAVSVPGFNPRNRSASSGGIGPARIDHDDARAAPLLVGDHALEQNRMTPCRVGAGQHQKIGLVEILVAAGHGIGAEGAAMAGDRRRHAQPRIGIDIGAADKSLHQLVGDVIVFGQQLPGQIERDRVRAVARDDVLKSDARHGRAHRSRPRAPSCRCCSGSWDRAVDSRGRGFRRAPSPSSRAGRNWRDVPGSPDIAAPPRPSGVASTPQPTPQ